MIYREIENLPAPKFKRLTGVKKEVFILMLDSVNSPKLSIRKHPTRGTAGKLSNADKVLLMLMYYREYRSQFHIGVTYCISEARVCEIMSEIEQILIKTSDFICQVKKNC